MRPAAVFLGVMLLLGALAARAGADPEARKAEEDGKTSDGKENLVELAIDLPRPLFRGTPKNIRSPNLEKLDPKKRKPLMAPPGTENLALGRPVSGSDEEPIIGELALITDGDKEATEGSYVEFGFGKQWVQIDLGAARPIQAVVVWHYHGSARVYRDVVVQISADREFIKGVKTVFNNDHDNSSGLGIGKDKEYVDNHYGRAIEVGGAAARYVRLYSKGNTSNGQNHYIEVEIYGTPEKKQAPAAE